MLIAMAVVAIDVLGLQYWAQSTAEYHLEGTIVMSMDDFITINAQPFTTWSERFNLDLGSSEPNFDFNAMPVKDDKSIVCAIRFNKTKFSTVDVTYKTTASYYSRAEKIDALETQLKNLERRKINSDIHFLKICIQERKTPKGRFLSIKEIPLDGLKRDKQK